jgi:hypothetical protein
MTMPYDPQNPDVFRHILKRLNIDQFLSSQAIIDLVLEHRQVRKDKNLPSFKISRSALDHFKSGDRIKNIQGLQEIYQFLENNSLYRFTSEAPQAPIHLGVALTQFFSNGDQRRPVYDLALLGDKLAGSYTFYCPLVPPGGQLGNARASFVEIARGNSEFKITETQRYPGFRQHDSGAMFSFAKFVYFLMNEEAPGTAVKFGLITKVFLYPGDPVEWFRGILFISKQPRHISVNALLLSKKRPSSWK